MYTDPIADFLTRVRNAQMANHRVVEIPSSNIKKRITEILYEYKFIDKYTIDEKELKGQGLIKIALKYDSISKKPMIHELKRLSSPGLRRYSNSTEIPRTMSGLGITIVSTSKGVMTDKEAKKLNLGGELICSIS